MLLNWLHWILQMLQNITMPDSAAISRVRLNRCRMWAVMILGIGICCLSFTSCDRGQEPPIPATEMGNILFDLQVAEDYSIGKFADSIPHGSEKNTDTLAYYYAIVLKHHHLSLDKLQHALEWYYAHPAAMDSVYRKVLEKANKYKGTDMPKTAPLAIDSMANNSTDTLPQMEAATPAVTPAPDRPERNSTEPADRTEDEELKDIRRKNKDIKETLDKVKKQAQ